MDMEKGEEGEGEIYRDSNMETYSTMCKIDSQWEFATWFMQHKHGLCDKLEGWDGEEDGREVQEGGDMGVPMAHSYWCLTENKIL